MKRKRGYDWFGFGVRFFFGALFGLFIGWIWWLRASTGTGPGPWHIMPAVATAFGALTGFLGDSLWESMRYWCWW